MKKVVFGLVIAAMFTIGAGFAGARPAATTHTATPVKVVMHDPGCHWFSVGSKFLTKLTVNGPAKLTNFDEATLKVKSIRGTTLAHIAKPIILKRGVYQITMVGQASDDNHLKLTVK